MMALVLCVFFMVIACNSTKTEIENKISEENKNIDVQLGDMKVSDSANKAEEQTPVMAMDPIQFLADNNISNVLGRKIQTFGNTTKVEVTYGATSMMMFGELNMKEDLVPKANKNNRPGTKLNGVEFIVIHDTGNNNAGATAAAHTNVIKNTSSTSSWHFVVDQNEVIKHMPTDEVAYHAGDGLRSFGLIDTKISAPKNPNLVVTVSAATNNKVYYVIDGQKTSIEVPLAGTRLATTTDLVPSGIYAEVGRNGNYYISKTYYNSSYKKIANNGGGASGIGIEACVNEGANLYATMQNMAKLVAMLLIEYDLPISRVLQHNNFSGKNCPQTLRTANLWNYFIKMVETEYELATTYKEFTFKVTSNNFSLVSTTARVIAKPAKTTEVNYQVSVTHSNGYSKSITLQSSIPGLETIK